jgi:hypothetical protein
MGGLAAHRLVARCSLMRACGFFIDMKIRFFPGAGAFGRLNKGAKK